jgi:hypothetical protein
MSLQPEFECGDWTLSELARHRAFGKAARVSSASPENVMRVFDALVRGNVNDPSHLFRGINPRNCPGYEMRKLSPR